MKKMQPIRLRQARCMIDVRLNFDNHGLQNRNLSGRNLCYPDLNRVSCVPTAITLSLLDKCFASPVRI